MELQVIIAKLDIVKGFCIMLRGHKPNPKFKETISDRILEYKIVYDTVQAVRNALIVTGHKVTLYNDTETEKYGKIYCELMAFQPFETIDE